MHSFQSLPAAPPRHSLGLFNRGGQALMIWPPTIHQALNEGHLCLIKAVFGSRRCFLGSKAELVIIRADSKEVCCY